MSGSSVCIYMCMYIDLCSISLSLCVCVCVCLPLYSSARTHFLAASRAVVSLPSLSNSPTVDSRERARERAHVHVRVCENCVAALELSQVRSTCESNASVSVTVPVTVPVIVIVILCVSVPHLKCLHFRFDF